MGCSCTPRRGAATIDTAGNRLTLPAERVTKMTGAATALISLEGENRQFDRLKELQRIADPAVSTKLEIPAAQLYTRAIYGDLKVAGQFRMVKWIDRLTIGSMIKSIGPIDRRATIDDCLTNLFEI